MSSNLLEFLCHSINGVEVRYDPLHSHAATHLEDTPRLKELVIEVVTNMTLIEDKIALHTDMGRTVGTSDVVDVDNSDEIVYAMRKNRRTDGPVPFTKSRDGQPCKFVTVALEKRTNDLYELTSAWIGTFGDDEPFPNSPDATERSIEFWSKRAFVWGSQEIIPGTIQKTCPWQP